MRNSSAYYIYLGGLFNGQHWLLIRIGSSQLAGTSSVIRSLVYVWLSDSRTATLSQRLMISSLVSQHRLQCFFSDSGPFASSMQGQPFTFKSKEGLVLLWLAHAATLLALRQVAIGFLSV